MENVKAKTGSYYLAVAETRMAPLKELFDEAINEGKRQGVQHFIEWLRDNHSIEIHDMIIQDYKKCQL